MRPLRNSIHITLLATVCLLLPARPMWGQAIQALDGILTPEERKAATDSLIEAEANVFIQNDTSLSLLRITVLSDSIGVASLCLGTSERVLVLHASAALGMLEYHREGPTWSTDSTFAWALRDTAMTAAALETRRTHLQDQGWVATTYQMGRAGEMEFLISSDLLPEGSLYLALGIMPVPRPMDIVGLPSVTAGDCARGDLVRGPAPQTGLRFDPESWKQVLHR